MTRPIATIARYALVEAGRGGLPWLVAACILAALGFAGFLSQVAITEASALQVSAAAALLRAAAVFLIVSHAVSSVVREANDKGLELALALPISRPAWYVGKLLGFACAGAMLAGAFAIPLAAWARPGDLAAWWVALTAELAVMSAAALFFASALGQMVSAVAAAAGLYLLARVAPAIQAIASGPLAADSATGIAGRWAIEMLGLLLPRLDRAASGDWLVYGMPAPAELAQSLTGLAIYFVLLASAGLFDFSRRNL
jgi:ABC-type transport system involved in multi-copper enzyme maturation permease subunit